MRGEIILFVAPPSTGKSTLVRRLLGNSALFELHDEWMNDITEARARQQLDGGVNLVFTTTPARREKLDLLPFKQYAITQLDVTVIHRLAYP